MLKICPYHQYNLSKIVEWLEEQSAYGLELENWGVFFVKFKESTGGEHFRYQIDMDDAAEEPNAFRRSELVEAGWEYVTTIGNSREHIYRCRDTKAFLPRNEFYIEYNRKKLNRDLFWSCVWALILVLLLLFIHGFRNEFVLLEFMQQDSRKLLFYTVWFVLTLYQILGEIYQNIKLYRYLDKVGKNTTLEEEERVEKGYGFHFPVRLLAWILLVCSLVSLLWIDDMEDVANLYEADASVKYVDLASFQTEGFEISEITWEEHSDINFGNRIEYIAAPFAKTYYEVNQYGGTTGNDSDEQMEGMYWDVTNEKIADRLFSQVIERYTKYSRYYVGGFHKEQYYIAENWTVTEQNDERFTELVIAEGGGQRYEGNVQIFARIGNQIICLRYWGDTSAEVLVEEIAKEFL